MLHRRSSLSLVFVMQGYDAKACRRLQSASPRLRRAKPRQPPQPPRSGSCLSGPVYLSDAHVSSEKCLVYLSDMPASSEKCLVSLPDTDVSSKKCLVYRSDTPASSKKCLVSPADTPARPKKRRFWKSRLSVPSYIRSILDPHHQIGPNIRRIDLSIV